MVPGLPATAVDTQEDEGTWQTPSIDQPTPQDEIKLSDFIQIDPKPEDSDGRPIQEQN